MGGRQLAFRTGVIFLISLFAAGVLFILLARAERGVRYEFNYTMGLRKIYTNVINSTTPTDIGVCACQPDRVERVVIPPGFETTFSIYEPGEPGPHPGLVLIHGNTWMGQRLSLYRLIAHSLAKKGFIVLTYDKIGAGESDDPYMLGPDGVAAAYNAEDQAQHALEYLIENTNVDPNSISLFGHSSGVSEALRVGQWDDRVTSVVVWQAPFAPQSQIEVDANLDQLSRKWIATHRIVYGTDIPEWFEWEMTGIVEEDPDIVWKYFRRPDHKPIIVFLAENDNPQYQDSIYDLFDSLSEPKDLIFLSRSNHYMNTAQSLRWVFYDRKLASELADRLATDLIHGVDADK